jgi:hypothetical protein
MNEIGNTEKPSTNFYWEIDGYNSNFDWHGDAHGTVNSKCGCGQEDLIKLDF